MNNRRKLVQKINSQLKSTVRIIYSDGLGGETRELSDVTRCDLCHLPSDCAIKYDREGLELATHNDSSQLMSYATSTLNISLSLALEYLSLQLSTTVAKLDQAQPVNTDNLHEAMTELKSQYYALGYRQQKNDYVLNHIPMRIAQLEGLLEDLSCYNKLEQQNHLN